MKVKLIISSIVVLVIVVFSCKKEPELPSGSNKIEMGKTIEDTTMFHNSVITSSVSTIAGNTITQHGHCWSTNNNPTIENNHTSLGGLSSPKSFTSELDSLEPNTKYYVRLYLNYSHGIIYGEEINIITLKTGIPIVNTSEVNNITLHTAQCGGNAIADSGLFIVTKGICWDTTGSVNIEDNIGFTTDGDSLGMFTSEITNLLEGVNYYVKAYAINDLGTSYGEVVQFTTVPITIPEVITSDITEITINSAASGGNVTSNGNGTVIARGIIWSTNQNPTINDNEGITEDGTGIGAFTSSLSSLQDGVFYYVRSYATNEKGIAYGEQKSFQTIGIGFPVLTTYNVINVTATTASCGGNISSAGNGSVTTRGICWNLTGSPTLDNNINFTTDGTGIGSFNSNLTGLIEGTQYFVAAYATNETGTSYGSIKSFTTVNINTPTVTTTSATNITTSSATAGGNVTDGGNQDVTQRGVCWSTNNNPTLENSLGYTTDGSGTGTYVSTINDLEDGTDYYFRAYAINAEGTGYGNIKQFTTIDITLPSVTTNEITDITNNSAFSGGNVTNDGNSEVTLRGVCWSTTSNPTISDNHTTNGTGTGPFTSNITGLIELTQYYATAYATNEKGTSYGEVKMFTTVPITTPTVTTTEITDITTTSAESGGNVTSNGNGIVTARGVCWNTAGNPTLENNIGHTTDGDGTGSFTSDITDLNENTTYFVIAYATNEKGTSYGDILQFTSLYGFTDPRDGRLYIIVDIGNQTWMAENLNYEAYSSYWYDNNSTNGDIYGRLYPWYAATIACPSGWHLPTDEEWKILEGNTDTQYGVGDAEWDGIGIRGYDAGKRLKTTTGWYTNTGTDAVGFSALPGGMRDTYGGFSYLSNLGCWWSSTANGSTQAWYRWLYDDNDGVNRYNGNKEHGLSVRCVKN